MTAGHGAGLTVVTAGAQMFADSLRAQGVATVEVAWSPPVPGTEDALTTVMLDRRRLKANAAALAALTSAAATLVDVRPAHEALDLRPGHFLHAGPPIG
ncbi:MAG: hypothetical protein M3Q82_03360, partial [Actinomycetota bacterium]|nr:hypothetical protein [Actinomycetota bacterium]